ncbi:MAG: PAS domain-containing hybrid sensor histidine kinase/response regulator [Thermodesulfobacteriota bacterium]
MGKPMDLSRTYRIVLENMKEEVYVRDLDMNIQYINPAAEALTGFSLSDALGKKCYEVFGDEKRECKKLCPVDKAISRKDHIVHHEGKLKTRTGEVKHMQVSISPIHEADAVTGAVVVMEDITRLRQVEKTNQKTLIALEREVEKRKRAEKALRRSEAFQKAILDGITHNLVFVDEDLNLLWANKAAANLEGIAPEDMAGRKCHAVWADPGKPCEGCPVIRAFQSKRPERSVVRSPDGRIWDIKGEPVFDPDGRLIGVLDIAENITERHHMEEHLRQTQKMEAIGTLAGGIAHDFNNILSIILGHAELAEGEIPEDSPTQDHLREIVSAGIRAKEMIQQLLGIARKTENDRQPVSVEPIVRETVSLMRATIPSRIEVRQHLSPGPHIVSMDPSQMQQVVLNLCTNAVHAMGDQPGVLDIRLKAKTVDKAVSAAHPGVTPGDYVQLTVRDTGPGIPPEIRDRIFDPYFTTKPPGEGSGMGLSVVQGIVRSLKGAVWVDGESGLETAFHILLPVSESAVDQVFDGISGTALPKGSERVLLVDDESAIVEVGKLMLEQLGYRVETRISPKEALALFQSAPADFDLVITDLTMPGISGEALSRDILRIRPEIPIILSSGYHRPPASDSSDSPGITGTLPKPYRMRDLAVTVRKVLDRKPN